MVKYRTVLPIKDDSGICKEIAMNAKGGIGNIINLTERTGEEHAIGVYKLDGNIEYTRGEGGKTFDGTSSMSESNINSIRRDVMEESGIDDPNVFYHDSDYFVILHTHPGGDPSPSSSDLMYLLNLTESIYFMEGKYTGQSGRLPVPNGLLAVSENKGDIIITGFEIKDNLPSFDMIEYYQDSLETLNLKRVPDLIDRDKLDDDKDLFSQSYYILVDILTEGDKRFDPVLDRCHAVIENG